MNSLVWMVFVASFSAGAAPREPQAFGVLARPQPSLHFNVEAPLTAYSPAPGDIVLSTSDKRSSTLLYRFVLVGLPTHIGIVVRLPEGGLGVFEAGGGGDFRTRTTALETRFARGGDRAIWIRKPKRPLTGEQERRLNEFAALSEDKGYSYRRALGLVWVFVTDARGPLRTFFDGQPKGLRDDFICSEAVLEALAYAGLVDSTTARPEATTPRDLMLDRSTNLYIRRHPPLACGWQPPALWIGCGAVSAECQATPACRLPAPTKRGLLRFRR